MSIETEPTAAQQEAEDKMRTYLESPEGSKKLSTYMSNEFKTEITVDKIEKGSIYVTLKLSSLDCVEKIQHLSSTGYLSQSMQYRLVTNDFLQNCRGCNHLSLKIMLVEDSYQKLMEQAKGKERKTSLLII